MFVSRSRSARSSSPLLDFKIFALQQLFDRLFLASLVLALINAVLAYSTLVAWGFYGLQAWGYLFGHGPRAQWTYKILYIVALPPAAAIDLGRVVDIVDSSFFLMAIPNVIALIFNSAFNPDKTSPRL